MEDSTLQDLQQAILRSPNVNTMYMVQENYRKQATVWRKTL